MPQRLFSSLLCPLLLACVVGAQDCSTSPPPTARIKAPVHNFTFSGRDPLLDESTLDEIAHIALTRSVSPGSVEQDMQALADEVAERTRVALQNQGYFQAEVESQAIRLKDDSGQYSIHTMIRSPYTQYRLGDITFVNATYFPNQQLRDLIPLHAGEIFSRQKIEEGLANLRRLYGSQGFINYTGVPETHFDDKNASVYLTISVDQGKQFHVRSIDVLGVDPITKASLLDELSMRPGDLYNSQAWESVFLKFPNLFPNPNLDAIGKTLDERNGQVDVLLDLRKKTPCPL